jgi:AmmeMemoRadiSam system protein A
MTAAKALGAARGVIVSYGNSGDALVGDKSRVVGYGSVIMASDGESPPALWDAKPLPPANAPLDASDKKALLSFARNTIRSYLDSETVPLGRNLPSRLQVPQGAFVTLKKHGELRGCIGHMASDTALGQTVGAMALEAAFGDPRFGPLQLSEFKDIEIEISVLMPMKPVAKASEIKVGRDGVVLRKGERSAVFLPQVAGEQGWDCDEMLENLCLKAGLPEGCWKQGSQLFVFQAEVFGERQPQ